MEWYEIHDKAFHGQHKKMLSHYQTLLKKFDNDSDFLYDYASALYLSGNFQEALKHATISYSLLSDYDTCLLIADIERDCEHFENALSWYWKAHYMCPSRFIPYYEIYNIYMAQNNKAGLQDMARIIKGKKVKKPSDDIIWIKNYVERTSKSALKNI